MAFLSDINIPLKGVVQSIAEEKIELAAINFCRGSTAWREEIDIDILELKSKHPVVSSQDAQVANVLSLIQDGSPLRFNYKHGDSYHSAGGNGTSSPASEPSKVVFNYYPSIGSDIKADTVLMPVIGNGFIDDLVFLEHKADIINGAIYLLMLMPNMEWTDYSSAMLYMKLFDNAKDEKFGSLLASSGGVSVKPGFMG